MQSLKYRNSAYLRFLRICKGKFCYLIDSLDNLHRWFFQKTSARQNILVDDSRCLHIICLKRDEYIIPTINCVNSFWQFHPEFKVKIWCDFPRGEILRQKKGKFHRIDRVELCQIDPLENWQENKLNIICHELRPHDIFSDADMFWNGRITPSNFPLFFLREYNLEEYATTKRLMELLKLDLKKDWFMLNVSVVNLGNLSQNLELSKRASEIFHKIMNISQDPVLGPSDISKLQRTSEQLALSISIQEKSKFSYLKETDGIMDGGIAESFYLGATRGY